jgi:hypothetical protein
MPSLLTVRAGSIALEKREEKPRWKQSLHARKREEG